MWGGGILMLVKGCIYEMGVKGELVGGKFNVLFVVFCIDFDNNL